MSLELVQDIKNNLSENKGDFFDSALGKAIDTGVNYGLRVILPEFAEDAVIGLKDQIIKNGLGETVVNGIKNVINTGTNLVKNFANTITGNINRIKEIHEKMQDTNVKSVVSNSLENAIKNIEKNKNINENIIKIVKDGKETILLNIDKNIDSTFKTEIKNLENVQKYVENWREAYGNKDFTTMEKEYKKMEKSMESLKTIENKITETRNIETLHNLIKNNGKDFNLSAEELKLADKLSL